MCMTYHMEECSIECIDHSHFIDALGMSQSSEWEYTVLSYLERVLNGGKNCNH